MKLTDPLKDLIIHQLKSVKLINNACALCGERRWVISERVMEVREYTGGSLAIGGGQSVIPLIAAFCANCGQVRLFNALVLGVVDPETGLLVDKDTEGGNNVS